MGYGNYYHSNLIYVQLSGCYILVCTYLYYNHTNMTCRIVYTPTCGKITKVPITGTKVMRQKKIQRLWLNQKFSPILFRFLLIKSFNHGSMVRTRECKTLTVFKVIYNFHSLAMLFFSLPAQN